MNKNYIIRKNLEFQNIIEKGNVVKNHYFIIRYVNNSYNHNRYGISVSKKYTNAVNRNRIKRQIKDILSKNKLNNSQDYVIICLKSILNLKYLEIEEELIKLLKETTNEKEN